MLVLLPDDLPVTELGALPDDLELGRFGLDAAHRPSCLGEVQGLVLDPRYRDRLVELLPDLTALRLVQAMNAGIDWVPALPEGVMLCRAGGVHDAPVAEWVLSVVLAMQKRLPWFWTEQARQHWDASANLAFGDGEPAHDLAGSVALIIGHGSIGEAVASRLTAFGVTVRGVTRDGRHGYRPGDVPQLLADADIVVLLAPATPDTARMVDAAFLGRMRPDGLLVNASRGGLVDTDALVEALRAGRVRAAVDATEPEPLDPDHPLWRCPGVMITPHVAGSSPLWRYRVHAFVGEQLRRWSAGTPLAHIVTGRS